MKINKSKLRAALLEKRKNLSSHQRTILNQKATSNLISYIKSKNKKETIQNISIFQSFKDEIDTSAIINYLINHNYTVCIPIIHPITSKHLIFQRIDKETPFIKNKFGICEPKLNVTQIVPTYELDLIIMPLTGFDRNGNRLGMGGGFYDRTFERYEHPNRLIGFAFSIQETEYIPTEKWDISVGIIITDH